MQLGASKPTALLQKNTRIAKEEEEEDCLLTHPFHKLR
jgi:hypothetical protein